MIAHLSLSSIKTYLSCPKLFWYQYVEKVPTPKSPYAVFGTAIHNTVEHHVAELTLTGASQQTLAERWPGEWATAKANEEPLDWSRVAPDSLYYAGLRICASASIGGQVSRMRALVQDGQPLIETFFQFEVDGVGVPIIGYVDIVTDDGVPGDFKTSKRPWTPDQAQRELQPLVYLLGLRALGLDVDGHFRHYVIPSAGYTALQVIESKHTDVGLAKMQDTMRTVWACVAAERFPKNPTYKWCGRYCPYLEICQP